MVSQCTDNLVILQSSKHIGLPAEAFLTSLFLIIIIMQQSLHFFDAYFKSIGRVFPSPSVFP